MLRIAFAAIMLVSTMAAAQSPQPPDRPQVQAQAGNNDSPGSDSQSASDVGATAPATPPRNSHAPKHSEEQAAKDGNRGPDQSDAQTLGWASVVTSLLVFGATVVLCIATWKLVDSTDDTAKKTLRAYVNQISGTLSDKSIANGVNAQVLVRNNGRTPAYKVSYWIRVAVADYPLTGNLAPGDHATAHGRSIMGPRAKVTLSAHGKFNQAKQDAFASGNSALYVYGEVAYSDVYNSEHVTKFRLIYGGPHAVGDAVLRHCDEGNEAT